MTHTAGISAEAVAGLVRDLGLAEDLLVGDYAKSIKRGRAVLNAVISQAPEKP